MRTVEVEGNSRVDATRRALELLGADIEDVKVEVIREEPRGMLGFLGFKRVTVRVTLLEQNVMEEAAEIINRIVSFLPVPAEARVEMHKQGIHLELAGHELRQFQKEEDIADALAHVVELIINRRAKNKIAVKASFAEDKISREEELQRLARASADRAAATGKQDALAPMTPRDRRTVHMALERDDRVVTESAGKGNKRHVVVFPAAAKRDKPAEGGGKPKGERRARPPRKPRSQKPEADKEKAGAKPAKSPRRRRRRKPRGGGPDKKQSPS
jgi:spoIIIJ-associated protein